MAKASRETRENSSAVTIILLVLLCVVSGAICYYFYNAYNDLVNSVVNYDDVYAQLQAEYKTLEEEYQELLEEKSIASNVENTIDETKRKYYKDVVEAERRAKSGEANFKVCFLTFDDGPYIKTTPKFLDVLEEKDVLATFFCMKKSNCEDIYLREKLNCHTIGNHTATHTMKYVYQSEDVFIDDLLENRKFIDNLLGITTNVMRFPGGSHQSSYMGLDRNSLISRLGEIEYGYIDWTNMTGDGDDRIVQNPDVYLHNVIDKIEGKNVITILMHDYSNCTLKTLPTLIDELEKRGYIFLPLCYECSSVIKG